MTVKLFYGDLNLIKIVTSSWFMMVHVISMGMGPVHCSVVDLQGLGEKDKQTQKANPVDFSQCETGHNSLPAMKQKIWSTCVF